MLGKVDACAPGLAEEFGVKIDGGCISKQNRVVLFSRGFPGTSKSGYCLRSRVIWWLYTGEALSGMEWNIHHKNHDRTDDRIENLEKIRHADHTHEHHGYRGENVKKEIRECEKCGTKFLFESSKAKDFSSGTRKRGRFCSAWCYQKSPKDKIILKEQTHCFQGHEYTEENTYWIQYVHAKRRSCKICRAASRVKRNARLKMEKKNACVD